jgi:hypothetical protein
MGLKGYRLWVMGQLDSMCRAPTRARTLLRGWTQAPAFQLLQLNREAGVGDGQRRGLHKLNAVAPQRESTRFHQPLKTYQVRNWFQAFAFKWVNLYRYITDKTM